MGNGAKLPQHANQFSTVTVIRMSAHFKRSGPRSQLYDKPRDSGWLPYNPFYAEGIAAFHRYEERLEEAPTFPRIITLPLLAGFIRPCNREQVKNRLAKMPPEHLAGLRGVFLLGGRRKQERSWYSNLSCYGFYWNDCVFLCAHPFNLGEHNLDSIRDYYLDDVLVHEVGHHVDRERDAPDRKKENFANGFAEQQRG